MMAALDEQPEVPMLPAVLDSRLEQHRIGELPQVYYVPNWIEKDQEAEFMAIADGDMSSWEDMRTRSSQEWGAGDRCGCGRGLMRMPLPTSQQRLADALHQLGAFDGALYPMNSVRINGYRPGQGIHPHCDGPVYYPAVGILSLGSPCIFSFYPRTGTEDCMTWDPDHDVPGGHLRGLEPAMSLVLEPRSLLVFTHDAFWHHRHGIEGCTTEEVTSKIDNLNALENFKEGDVIRRGRRVSLTMRHLLPRCACQG
jgi:alkylated DNA repair protein alkB family protein 6